MGNCASHGRVHFRFLHYLQHAYRENENGSDGYHVEACHPSGGIVEENRSGNDEVVNRRNEMIVVVNALGTMIARPWGMCFVGRGARVHHRGVGECRAIEGIGSARPGVGVRASSLS